MIYIWISFDKSKRPQHGTCLKGLTCMCTKWRFKAPINFTGKIEELVNLGHESRHTSCLTAVKRLVWPRLRICIHQVNYVKLSFLIFVIGLYMLKTCLWQRHFYDSDLWPLNVISNKSLNCAIYETAQVVYKWLVQQGKMCSILETLLLYTSKQECNSSMASSITIIKICRCKNIIKHLIFADGNFPLINIHNQNF